MKTVSVVGLGYVGLPTAALLARAGFKVQGMDKNEKLVEELQRGECRLEESDVNDLVKSVLKAGTLTASLDPEPADVFVICVPTPVGKDDKADLSMVKSAIKATAPCVKAGDLVILESTSPIGTTEKIIGAALKEVGLDPQSDVDVCYCPERVFPGNTIREILDNDRIIGGLTVKAAEKAQKFYAAFCNGQPVLTTAATAEFSKLMENTYRDVNIALANVFARIAENTDVNVKEVIALANMHPRVNVHTPGPGVGGHCIPVDPKFLIEAFPEETKLLSQSREINDTQASRLIDRAESAGLSRGSKVAIMGAAYRGDIDDARDTPTELLIGELSKRGYTWQTHDPHVTLFKLHNECEPYLTSNLQASLEGAEAVFIMTAHSEYNVLTASDFSGMGDTALIVDGPVIMSREMFAEGRYTYLSTGQRV
ncbi:nucleotide sugar dehydrogenase [Litorimonas haliclonae]|uniref:nucleotide sugar dehydrogenase n=1 Tax=Litorimonas haliclonae TaxID=2081977 RepID=UPI0039F145E3